MTQSPAPAPAPDRRRFLTASLGLALVGLAAPALIARPAQAAPVPLADISAYLNTIRSVQTEFSQVNPDGSSSAGQLMIRRPGRMRFEYARPDRSLVLASGGQVAIFDAKSNQDPEQYPLSRTPLNLILANRVDLGRARMVVGHGEANGLTTVVAQDPENPQIGTLTLYFQPRPLRLVQWMVTDEAGGRTLVKLGPLQEASFQPSVFSITREVERRQR